MNGFSKAAAAAALLVAVIGLGPAAGADDFQCARGTSRNDVTTNPGGLDPQAVYCDADTPSRGAVDANDQDGVQPTSAVNGGAGGAETGGSSGVDGAASAGAPAAGETTPSGSLPITGGDVVGLTVIGAAAVGLGTVLVRRSRRGGAVTA